MRSFAVAAFPANGGAGGAEGNEGKDDAGASRIDAAHLARFLFVLGEVGLRHLVHVEGLA